MSLFQGMQCQLREPQVSCEYADMTLGKAPCCTNSQVRPRKPEMCANSHPWLIRLVLQLISPVTVFFLMGQMPLCSGISKFGTGLPQ